MNMIRKPKKMLGSLIGDFILANIKAIKTKRKGTKMEAKPKYWFKRRLYSVGMGPVWRKEKTEIVAKIKKKIKKIV
jgi:hypothetical protein